MKKKMKAWAIVDKANEDIIFTDIGDSLCIYYRKFLAQKSDEIKRVGTKFLAIKRITIIYDN